MNTSKHTHADTHPPHAGDVGASGADRNSKKRNCEMKTDEGDGRGSLPTSGAVKRKEEEAPSPPSRHPATAVGADDARHGVPAGPRAPVSEVHRTGAHVTGELLESRREADMVRRLWGQISPSR